MNYNQAWTMRIPSEGSPIDAQRKLPSFRRIQPSRISDVDVIRRHLIRGKLTLDLITNLSIDENPDFARVSAMWLPVQAYYAVNGFGMAVIAARKGPGALPTSHRAFLSEIASNYVRGLFPKPYSAMLRNGYRAFNYLPAEFINVCDDRTSIGSGFNLRWPDPTTRDAHITQCLDTTRRRLVVGRMKIERNNRKKPEKQYGVVKRSDQIKIARSMPPTTVLNYLYRSRIKSNYEDVTMYQVREDHSQLVLELVRSTQRLATTLCNLLLTILWKVANKSTRCVLEKDDDLRTLLTCTQLV